MIIEGLFNLLFGVVGFILGLFPAMPSFDSLNQSLEPVLYVLGFINNFISLKLVGGCLLTVLLVCNAKFIWSLFMWLVRKIPGVS